MFKNLRNPVFVAVIVLVASNAMASGSGMPWESPLNQILNSFTGPVARVLGALAIATTGLTLAFSETHGILKKVIQVVFGLSIAFTATSFGLGFLGFGGGAGF